MRIRPATGGRSLLARSLAIKVDDKCLSGLHSLQAPCLMPRPRPLSFWYDLHSTVDRRALTSGPAVIWPCRRAPPRSGLVGYVQSMLASVMDMARIFDSFRYHAQYQYIPALTAQHGNRRCPDAEHAAFVPGPKSVLVAGSARRRSCATAAIACQ